MRPTNTSRSLNQVLRFLALLLLPARLCAQAGIDHVPDDVFAPPANAYYISAMNNLRLAANFIEQATNTKLYDACLQIIERVYRIEGNYAGALELLIGLPVPHDENPTLQMSNGPTFSLNMQQLIGLLRKQMHTDGLQANLYGELSAIYEQIGDTVKALNYQLKANKLFSSQKAFNEEKYTEALLRTGTLYLLAGDENNAMRIYASAEKQLTQQKASSLYIDYLALKGLLHMHQGRLKDAISVYEDIFKQLKQGNGKHRRYYEMACTLGNLYKQAKRYETADSVLRRNFDKLHALQYKSALFQQTANSYYENLLCLKKYADVSQLLESYIYWLTMTAYNNSRGFAESDLLCYTKRLDRAFNIGYNILCSPQNTNDALRRTMLFSEIQRKGLVLTNRADLYRNENRNVVFYDKKTQEFVQPEIPTDPLRMTNELIAKEYSLPLVQRRSHLDSLEERSAVLEREMAVEDWPSYSHPEDKKFEAMTLMTEGNAANIQFVRFDRTDDNGETRTPWYGAFVFKQSLSDGEFVPLCSEAALLKLMKDSSGNWLDESTLTTVLYGSRNRKPVDLYRLLWQPLEPYLKGFVYVNYAAVGFLNNISFNAIYTGTGYLLHRYELRCFASLLTLSQPDQPLAKPTLVSLWGEMNYGNATEKATRSNAAILLDDSTPQTKGIDTLPFQRLFNTEIDTLKKLFDSSHIKYSSMEANAATEETFKRLAPKVKGVIHLSTHGFYTAYDKTKAIAALPGNYLAGITNPLFRSGLAFAGINTYWQKRKPELASEDGLLTAYEIEQMDLHKTQLAVLSACETGLGDVTEYEGNLGLQRAFKLAGVRYLLVSLWPVGPSPTTRLLKYFYKNWLSGLTPAEALRQSQKVMQDEGQLPYFWAGFVLIE